jgi:hypothetical protein
MKFRMYYSLSILEDCEIEFSRAFAPEKTQFRLFPPPPWEGSQIYRP